MDEPGSIDRVVFSLEVGVACMVSYAREKMQQFQDMEERLARYERDGYPDYLQHSLVSVRRLHNFRDEYYRSAQDSYSLAEEGLKTIIEHKPNVNAYLLLIEVLEQQERYDDALEVTNICLKIYRENGKIKAAHDRVSRLTDAA